MTNNEAAVAKFATQFVEEAWLQNPATGVTRCYSKSRLNEILQFSSTDFIVGIAKHLDRRDVQLILLSAKVLWLEIGIEEWRQVLGQLSPRPKRGFADCSGFYSDIEFLTRYLNVDPIALAFSPQTGLNIDDKTRICEFCRDEAGTLLLSNDDKYDLDGELLCSMADLNAARNRLIEEDKSVRPKYDNADTLKAHATEFLALLC